MSAIAECEEALWIVEQACLEARSERDEAYALLRRWVEAYAAMGSGPKSRLTQDTLDFLPGRVLFDDSNPAEVAA